MLPQVKKSRKRGPKEIRAVLLRHKGAMKQVAEALGVGRPAVTQTLNGGMASQRILEACRVKAEYLESRSA